MATFQVASCPLESHSHWSEFNRELNVCHYSVAMYECHQHSTLPFFYF